MDGMKIYIDTDFKCHVSPGEGLTAVETEFFDGKCAAYIEGYRYVPAGQSWTRGDGEAFAGEMVAPWLDHRALEAAQSMFEQSEAAHIAEVAELVEMIYDADMEVIG
jgi:hypothetical protein